MAESRSEIELESRQVHSVRKKRGRWKANNVPVDRVCVRSLLALSEWQRWSLLREYEQSFTAA